MPSNLIWTDDAGQPVSLEDFGSINAGDSVVVKVFLKNTGTTGVNSAVLSKAQVGGSDGFTFVSVAQDNGTNNPGTYTTAPIAIGDIAASQAIPFWLKVALGANVSPGSNPRQFFVNVDYVGS